MQERTFRMHSILFPSASSRPLDENVDFGPPSFHTHPIRSLCPRQGVAYDDFVTWVGRTGAIEALRSANSPTYRKIIACKLKEYFVSLATTKIPLIMGHKYSSVLVTCLTCLDEENETFSEEQEMFDENGIFVSQSGS